MLSPQRCLYTLGRPIGTALARRSLQNTELQASVRPSVFLRASRLTSSYIDRRPGTYWLQDFLVLSHQSSSWCMNRWLVNSSALRLPTISLPFQSPKYRRWTVPMASGAKGTPQPGSSPPRNSSHNTLSTSSYVYWDGHIIFSSCMPHGKMYKHSSETCRPGHVRVTL